MHALNHHTMTLASTGIALGLMAAVGQASAVELTAQQVQDRAAIEETMSRYMYALDTADPDAYASVYAPDGEIVIGGKVLEHGRKALHDYVAGLRKQWKMAEGQRFGNTRHIYYNFTVEIDGDTAQAQSYWQTLLANPEGGPWRIFATGVSEDTLVRINGSWLIAKRVIIGDPTEAAKPTAASGE